MFANAYSGKHVLVTGHTGFKGTWLCCWLKRLGAKVHGIALQPETRPAMFTQLDMAHKVDHKFLDIRDRLAVCRVVASTRPDFVFHLAAQPLVRHSYSEPVVTFETNVMGTVNILDAVRACDWPCNVVVVTTDKCYENREWLHSYREEDPLGGRDPYSASKAAAEIVASAYRSSYFSSSDTSVHLATARAGNVIGGGDWATDRIVPDCVRSLLRKQVIPVRNRIATRPWQHVLEPLSGYLWLGAHLSGSAKSPHACKCFESAFNFGPTLTSNRTVADLVQTILGHWPGEWQDRTDPNTVHEATKLNLATDKAFHLLGWQSIWSFEETVERSIHWYRSVMEEGNSASQVTSSQIEDYESAAKATGQPWTTPQQAN